MFSWFSRFPIQKGSACDQTILGQRARRPDQADYHLIPGQETRSPDQGMRQRDTDDDIQVFGGSARFVIKICFVFTVFLVFGIFPKTVGRRPDNPWPEGKTPRPVRLPVDPWPGDTKSRPRHAAKGHRRRFRGVRGQRQIFHETSVDL